MGIVKAVCISEKRGTEKKNVGSANFIAGFGIENDAHAGDWHRQVSLLSYDKVEEFNRLGAGAENGAFGENLVVTGFDFKALPVGTVLSCGNALLELTQIGKECYTHCQIYHRMGDCIMPREGVFAKVLHSGVISVGDEMEIAVLGGGKLTAAVITLSDKGFAGGREDKSGPLAAKMLTDAGYEIAETLLLPDEQSRLEAELIRLCDGRQINLIITTGGTGFSPRDITPEATLAVADKNASGIAEAIRAYSMTITKRAMLSRGVSVIRGKSLIVNLPGSPKAVNEALGYILPELLHGLEALKGDVSDCADATH